SPGSRPKKASMPAQWSGWGAFSPLAQRDTVGCPTARKAASLAAVPRPLSAIRSRTMAATGSTSSILPPPHLLLQKPCNYRVASCGSIPYDGRMAEPLLDHEVVAELIRHRRIA